VKPAGFKGNRFELRGEVSNMNNARFALVISIVALIASVVFGIISNYTSRQTLTETRASKRPYFSFDPTNQLQFPAAGETTVVIKMTNIGEYPATEVVGKVLIVGKDLKAEPAINAMFSIASDIPKGIFYTWACRDDCKLPANLSAQYIVVGLKYRDPILNQTHEQSFFVKWKGTTDGKADPEFFHISTDESKAVAQAVGRYL